MAGLPAWSTSIGFVAAPDDGDLAKWRCIEPRIIDDWRGILEARRERDYNHAIIYFILFTVVYKDVPVWTVSEKYSRSSIVYLLFCVESTIMYSI